jgi:hypothetical protein
MLFRIRETGSLALVSLYIMNLVCDSWSQNGYWGSCGLPRLASISISPSSPTCPVGSSSTLPAGMFKNQSAVFADLSFLAERR